LREIQRYDTLTRHNPNDGYDTIKPPEEWGYFVLGSVFKVRTFAEGESVGRSPSVVDHGDHFEKKYRFIVIFPHTREHWSHCVQISTHDGEGCGKRGLEQKKHTMVYTGAKPPPKLSTEVGMNKDPIRMEPIDQTEKLDAISRINLAKLHVIEHNVMIKPVGKIVQSDLRKLKAYCTECISGKSKWD